MPSRQRGMGGKPVARCVVVSERGAGGGESEKPPIGGFSDEWVTIALDEWIG
jgi:hypothetical protein